VEGRRHRDHHLKRGNGRKEVGGGAWGWRQIHLKGKKKGVFPRLLKRRKEDTKGGKEELAVEKDQLISRGCEEIKNREGGCLP